MPAQIQYTFLYEFTLNGKVWRYTANAEDVIDADENVWESASISDDGVNTSGEASADALTVTASTELVPARIFMYSPPTSVMDLRILRATLPSKVSAAPETGIDSTVDQRLVAVTALRFRYVGEISQCTLGTPGTVRFTAETLSASMSREGLRMCWQRSCPHSIYSLACGANKAANAVAVTVTANDGLTISVTPPVAADYEAGILDYTHPVKGAESATIESGTGGSLVVFGGSQDLYVGQQIVVYRGCNQTPEACQSHDNYPQYGGIKDLPGSSPFDGLSAPSF